MGRSEQPGLLLSFDAAHKSTTGYDGLPDVIQQEASITPGEHYHGKSYPSLTGGSGENMLNENKRM